MINHLDESGATRALPVPADPDMAARPFVDDFPAGYMLRGLSRMPKQGDRDPWTASQSYSHDKKVLLAPDADIDDGVVQFSSPVPATV